MSRSVRSLLRMRERWAVFFGKLDRARTRERIDREDREASARLLVKIREYEKEKEEQP